MYFQYGNDKAQRVYLNNSSYVFQKKGEPIKIHSDGIINYVSLRVVEDNAPLLKEDFNWLQENGYLKKVDPPSGKNTDCDYWVFVNGACAKRKTIYGSKVKKENRVNYY